MKRTPLTLVLTLGVFLLGAGAAKATESFVYILPEFSPTYLLPPYSDPSITSELLDQIPGEIQQLESIVVVLTAGTEPGLGNCPGESGLEPTVLRAAPKIELLSADGQCSQPIEVYRVEGGESVDFFLAPLEAQASDPGGCPLTAAVDDLKTRRIRLSMESSELAFQCEDVEPPILSVHGGRVVLHYPGAVGAQSGSWGILKAHH